MTSENDAILSVSVINQMLLNKTLRDVTEELDTNPGNLSAVVHGTRKPTRKLMKALGMQLPPRRKFDASYRELREIGARIYIAI